MSEYQPRVIDQELDDLMSGLPAIALEGPKGVGKTVTAARRATTIFPLDLQGQRELLAANPSRLDEDGTVLIDEWQRWPEVWDLVRRRVDAGAPAGHFLLTGSAAPVQAPTHSGAGRIVRIRMRPLALAERGIAEPAVSLAELLSGARPRIDADCGVTLPGYTDEVLSSGFPGIRSQPPRLRRAQLGAYLDNVVTRDFAEQGVNVRRPAVLRGWLSAYAAATASTVSYNTLLRAATPGEDDKPTKKTTINYRDVLSQLWLLEPLPGWLPTRNFLSQLGQAPKHHLADPALAAHLLGVDENALLRGQEATALPRDGALLGALFESLVALSVRVYAQAAEASVHHLRTHRGEHEVDLIVQGRDQRVLALEVKLGGTPNDSDVAHLLWLREKLGDDLADAAVLTTGEYAYRRPDGIAVIPAALLGP